jgi:hypothetical protein
LAGQHASGGVLGSADPQTGKSSSTAHAELITKHGGTMESATIYCEGAVLGH